MSRHKLTEQIKQEARRLGFQLVGIATPEPPVSYPAYKKWVEQGMHGEMRYLASPIAMQKRADPRAVLQEVKSILVLGIRYPDPRRGRAYARQGTGRVASYAWGDDYHDTLKSRLHALVEYIEKQAGKPVPNRWYTDTGPILEREFAVRAGLGWIGKNSCLINPAEGSYFFLAEILLGLELQPDPAFSTDHCGSCTRCIQACPTDCILPDRTLDAKRCISYLTIELKGPIPEKLRSKLSGWVFGCDICQEVCPWNIRFAAEKNSAPEFEPRPGLPAPLLINELQHTPQDFNKKFKGSPVKRTKRRGYLRNIACVLGKRKDQDAVPALLELLQDIEPLIRGHAAWALGQIGGSEALTGLESALQSEQDEYTKSEILNALKTLKKSAG